MIHELKCWPEYYDAVATGVKPFEVRKNDRDFRVGDVLRLSEFDPDIFDEAKYTGAFCKKKITYMLTHVDHKGIAEGFVVLGLVPYIEKTKWWKKRS